MYYINCHHGIHSASQNVAQNRIRNFSSWNLPKTREDVIILKGSRNSVASQAFQKDAGTNRSIHPVSVFWRFFSDHSSWELKFPGDLMAKIEGILEVFSNFNHCLISLAAMF